MNSSAIRFLLGYVLAIEGILLLLPAIVAAIYGENSGLIFLLVAAVCIILGVLFTRKKPASHVFYLKEGCVITALSWIVLSVFGCLPFVISRQIPSFTDALFETISGFTTTGASILNDIESLDRCMLFWRSFTHWIGGMGV
ncbi:MAG: TrkH family potassium uptake protein, partial [Lachnospiraceae bacterium]|nr:TrkH family potassium uptake protein [Lachnospiraceae bacterium]